ncbi:MAG: FecR domain-containing protein [Thermostichales cyanobacterium BF4_bins_65]
MEWLLGWLVAAGDPALAAPLARVEEIYGQPVTVVSSPQAPRPAAVGMELFAGDQLRTGSHGRAQVQQSSGFFVRVGANAVLTVLLDNEVRFAQGRMITWVEGAVARPVRIVTPLGVAALQGTTLFVDAPEHGRWVRFFSWEGEIRISAGRQSVTLNSGESVLVPRGATRLPRPYRLPGAVLRRQFQESVLLHGFGAAVATIGKIQGMLESADAGE